MNVDHTQVLKLAEKNKGIVSHKIILDEFKWDTLRIENVLNSMIKEGIVWLDVYSSGMTLQKNYYFPSLFM